MEDPKIHASIEQLVAEEHELWERESAGNATDGDRQRLEQVKVSLDQCWDLLRQRRAKREAGQDPDAAQARPADVVEHYQQEAGVTPPPPLPLDEWEPTKNTLHLWAQIVGKVKLASAPPKNH